MTAFVDKEPRSHVTKMAAPLHMDWAGLESASLDGDREIPELVLAKYGDRFTIRIPAHTKSLIESVARRAQARKIPRSQRTEVMIAGWCAEEALMGFDLTNPDQAAEWDGRTTFFMSSPVEMAESTFIRLSSAYRLQLEAIAMKTAQQFGCFVSLGWVLSRLVAIALTDQRPTSSEAA